MSELEFYFIVTENDGKTETNFGKLVENQLARLEKEFKEARDNLRVLDKALLNKDAIWPDRKFWKKWKEVKLTWLWYFYMKILVEDRFVDIRAPITNSDQEIEMDLMVENLKRANTKILEVDDADRVLEKDALVM